MPNIGLPITAIVYQISNNTLSILSPGRSHHYGIVNRMHLRLHIISDASSRYRFQGASSSFAEPAEQRDQNVFPDGKRFFRDRGP